MTDLTKSKAYAIMDGNRRCKGFQCCDGVKHKTGPCGNSKWLIQYPTTVDELFGFNRQ